MKTHINLILNEKESDLLLNGKENAGLKSNSEYVRYLITKNGK